MVMRILAIETSCDETSVAVVQDGTRVLSNVISSSRKTFEALAGVIPEQAARMQVECMVPVLERALTEAKISWDQVDAIAVTRGPGLLGSLLVGTVTGRALASLHKKPLIGVHHTLGHLSSTWLYDQHPVTSNQQPATPLFPVLTLSASGGHTDLWYRTSHTQGLLIGSTRDDAAGEAFDKGASLLGLPYPGGPSIEKASADGDPLAFEFPRPLHDEETLDFSFSGLKTSLKYLLRDLSPSHHPTIPPSHIAASYQHAICRHLVDRIERALAVHPDTKEVHIVGGVSANGYLRELAKKTCGDIPVRVPSTLSYCTDNAAMIAAAAFFMHEELHDEAFAPFATSASMPMREAVPRGRSQ